MNNKQHQTPPVCHSVPQPLLCHAGLSTFGFSKIHFAVVSGAVHPPPASGLALQGDFPLSEHIRVCASASRLLCSVSSVWIVLLCPCLIGWRECRSAMCWQRSCPTFSSAPVREIKPPPLLLPTPVYVLITGGCSAVFSETHLQDVTCTCGALNILDIIVSVLISLPMQQAQPHVAKVSGKGLCFPLGLRH